VPPALAVLELEPEWEWEWEWERKREQQLESELKGPEQKARGSLIDAKEEFP